MTVPSVFTDLQAAQQLQRTRTPELSGTRLQGSAQERTQGEEAADATVAAVATAASVAAAAAAAAVIAAAGQQVQAQLQVKSCAADQLELAALLTLPLLPSMFRDMQCSSRPQQGVV